MASGSQQPHVEALRGILLESGHQPSPCFSSIRKDWLLGSESSHWPCEAGTVTVFIVHMGRPEVAQLGKDAPGGPESTLLCAGTLQSGVPRTGSESEMRLGPGTGSG